MHVSKAPSDEWSGGFQLLWLNDDENGHFSFPVRMAKEGQYTVNVVFGCFNNMPRVQVLIDGKKVGDSVDLYSADEAKTTGVCQLGDVFLAEGLHEVTIQIVGRNVQSCGYAVGMDYIAFISR